MKYGTYKLLSNYIILATLLLQFFCVYGQAPDSTDFYKKLKKSAYKRKVTRLIYDGVFTEPPVTVISNKDENKSKSNKQKKKDPNAKYIGRTIRSIQITVYDPFGHSVNDTLKRKINYWQRAGNNAHTTTRTMIIKNLLLFRKYDPVDILEITESERILRETQYVNDARIHLEGSNNPNDSVDVRVVVHDRFSWDAMAGLNGTTGGNITLRDRNVVGLGQQFEQYAAYDYQSTLYEFRSRYNITNISNTYISSTLFYNVKPDISQAGISFDRPFYSSLAKWAGGLSHIKTWSFYNHTLPDSSLQKLFLDYVNSDYWIGRTFYPDKNNNTIDKKSRNVGVALRFANTHYQFKPNYSIDTNRTHVNSSLYMGSVSYSVRKYYKDKYIYRFGANEDIPEGWLFQLVGGILDREQFKHRYYTGLEVSRARHFERFGYISGTVSYGSFFNTQVRNEAALNAGIYYFTNLLKMRRWNVRQFLNYKIVYGINKNPRDYLALRGEEMYGFNGDTLRGSRKMILTLETVLYSPFNKLGFSLAPVLLLGFGMLERDREQLFNTQIYQSYALGLLIRNENLLTSTFQITFGAYPYLAEGTTGMFKFNPITSFTLRFHGFAITRPNTVAYQ